MAKDVLNKSKLDPMYEAVLSRELNSDKHHTENKFVFNLDVDILKLSFILSALNEAFGLFVMTENRAVINYSWEVLVFFGYWIIQYVMFKAAKNTVPIRYLIKKMKEYI